MSNTTSLMHKLHMLSSDIDLSDNDRPSMYDTDNSETNDETGVMTTTCAPIHRKRKHTSNRSCLRVPQYQKIELTDEQRQKLTINMSSLLQYWNKNNFSTTERVWSLKTKVRMNTYMSQRTIDEPVDDIPKNLFCMHPPPEAIELLSKTKTSLDFFFSHLLNMNSKFSALQDHPRANYVREFAKTGLVLFPSNKTKEYELHGQCARPSEFRRLLQSEPKLRVIDQLWSIYQDKIIHHLAGTENVPQRLRARIEELIDEYGDLALLKYAPGVGLWMHLDNLLRSDATVFAVGLGREVVYDMTRVLGQNPDEEPSILRSYNPEGTMMVLDGESRYKWAHGVPGNGQSNAVKKTKYSVILRLFHHEELSRDIGYCKEIKTSMYTMMN